MNEHILERFRENKPKFAKVAKLKFTDWVVLDYALEELDHLDPLAVVRYIEALVSAINYRARMTGTDRLFTFVFKMPPGLWALVSEIWASRVPMEDESQIAIIRLRFKWFAIWVHQVLTVHGVEYPVILTDQDELTLEPQQDDAPGWLYGVIKNIPLPKPHDGMEAVRSCDPGPPIIMKPKGDNSHDESGGDRCWRYGSESCPRICGDERH